ncbi:Arc family DNA-binding protein [Acinetobacter haemolyticus]|uniref:Arc family DNA-binding protein n=1 Tax=Acinetobacter haemolyticus TaxID=29430 RepID=UPI001331EF7F|nr:Arc family DNA-binding protein [Acinetobacter haemolyticus]QHI17067.1 Arc family DNA-binding protein [Acinetobacter haemolyticus]
MARTDPQVNFRIPAELKDKLDNAAKENGRTLTAELILRLEMTFEQDDQVSELLERINKLEDDIHGLSEDNRELSYRVDRIESGMR